MIEEWFKKAIERFIFNSSCMFFILKKCFILLLI